MTVTPAKLEANRRNAKKSTGPRTAEGKRRSSRNGATHGIFCNDVVLPREDQGEFEALRDSFHFDLQPVGIVEMMFVDRIIIAAWKLKRLNRIEGLITDSYALQVNKQYRKDLRKGGTDVTEMTFDVGDVPAEQSQAIGFVDRSQSVERMGRHAQRLELSISRAMRELRTLQKERSKRTQSPLEKMAEFEVQRVIMPEVEEEVDQADVAEDPQENVQSEANDEGGASAAGIGSGGCASEVACVTPRGSVAGFSEAQLQNRRDFTTSKTETGAIRQDGRSRL